jgi:hypothetical protein
MPKKNLTKSQVIKTISAISKNLTPLFMDKLTNPESKVTLSLPMMVDLNKKLASAIKRVK